jgi:DNA-binding protein HU-beta
MNKNRIDRAHRQRRPIISKAAAGRAHWRPPLSAVKTTLKEGVYEVSLVGFGTFEVGKRAARTGRNPRTGEPIKIDSRPSSQVSSGQGAQGRA